VSLKQQLIDALPPFKGERILIKKHQGTTDIINEICEAHNFFQDDYDKIYDFFDTGDIYRTCKKIFDFEKQNLQYDAESGKDQSSKSPSAILQTPADCKHYALFTSGILAAIQDNEHVKWDWFYCFASDKDVRDVSHVFVIVDDGKREIWIDPCLTNFDQRKKYLITKNEKPVSLYRISGVDDATTDQGTIIVGKQQAFESFLIMLAKNLFPVTAGGISAIKTLMLNNPSITNGPVKNYFVSMGFDWNQVQQFLNS